MKKLLLLLLLPILIFSSCKKLFENPDKLIIKFTHTVNGEPLVLNEMIYTNEAGQKFSVINLEYLFHYIELIEENCDGDGGVCVYLMDNEKHYVNISDPKTHNLNLELNDGRNYDKIGFSFGADISNTHWLNEDFYASMVWPEMMGGGFHYMKLEGKFENDTSSYNIHTGAAGGKDFRVTKELDINLSNNLDGSTYTIEINMDIANWFKGPNTITLTSDGIMENESIQQQLRENGEADVFSTSTH